MKTFIFSAALVLGTSAAVLRRDSHSHCWYTFTADGPVSGPINQIEDGQLRLGEGSPAKFKFKDGYMYDEDGDGCVITSPQNQIQCDSGSTGKSRITAQW